MQMEPEFSSEGPPVHWPWNSKPYGTGERYVSALYELLILKYCVIAAKNRQKVYILSYDNHASYKLHIISDPMFSFKKSINRTMGLWLIYTP